MQYSTQPWVELAVYETEERRVVDTQSVRLGPQGETSSDRR